MLPSPPIPESITKYGNSWTLVVNNPGSVAQGAWHRERGTEGAAGCDLDCGVRPAEISRLDWKEVRLDRAYIEVTAAKSKTASRRSVKMLPNLRAWLEPHAKDSGSVQPINNRKKTDAARIRAGLDDWPSNALRHSYASYHLAKFQDSAALALEMGHTTTAMLFAHYREVVTPEDAEAYWRIVPSKGA